MREPNPESKTARWKVGAVTITAILESSDAFSSDFLRRYVLPDATVEGVKAMPWLCPFWVDEAGALLFVTQSFLIESAGKRIIVDTCLGNDKPRRNPAFDRLQTPFLERLEAAGAEVDDVDFVLCTHLHFDHVGWNTRWNGQAWVPTFPRARYLFAEDEWNYWRSRENHAYVLADSIQPVLDAGLAEFVPSDFALTPEVSLESTPGHTPGHVSVRIRSGGAEAVITGDVLHHPCQVGRPEWTSPADTDPRAARLTREALLADASARHVLVVGTHFAYPAAGWVRTIGPGRALEPCHGEPLEMSDSA